MNNRTREGFLYGLAAYGWWGLVPLYFRLLKHRLGALDMLAHRIVWSMVFLAFILTLARKWGAVRKALHFPNAGASPPSEGLGQRPTPSIVVVLSITTILIAINWGAYILAVVREQVVQASLGYYITPLVSIVLGMIFFHERLRRVQWAALGLATVGVLWLTWSQGDWPWIAVSIALSFGFYGLLRKRIPVDGLIGLSVETLFLMPAALGYLLFTWLAEPADARTFDPAFAVVIFMSGIVTAVPLLCFGQAAQRLPLSTLGFLQYLAPSVQFLLAIFVLGEEFDLERFYAFLFIWAGLVLFSVDSYRVYRPTLPARSASSGEGPRQIGCDVQ